MYLVGSLLVCQTTVTVDQHANPCLDDRTVASPEWNAARLCPVVGRNGKTKLLVLGNYYEEPI